MAAACIVRQRSQYLDPPYLEHPLQILEGQNEQRAGATIPAKGVPIKERKVLKVRRHCGLSHPKTHDLSPSHHEQPASSLRP